MEIFLFVATLLSLYISSSAQSPTGNLNPTVTTSPSFDTLDTRKSEQKSKLINGYKVICYYESISLRRTSSYLFYPKHINTTYCTHIVSAYATLDPREYVIRNSSVPAMTDPESRADYRTLSRVKESDPGIKIIIAIGGWLDSRFDDIDAAKYSNLARDGARRQKFIDSVIQFLDFYNFDGLSFEWQDPTFVSNHAQDRENYVTLLREIKERFGSKYELLVAVSSAEVHRPGYDLVAIQDIVDTISIMSFNYVGHWTDPKLVGHHSALRQRPEAEEVAPLQSEWGVAGGRSPSEGRSVSVESHFRYLLHDLKLRPEKLVLGIPFFGRSFHLADDARNGPFDPFDSHGQGQGRVAFLAEGMRTFSEICIELSDISSSDVPVVTYDHNHWVAPYSSRRRFWIAYDDERSSRIKVNWMKEKSLGGVLIFTLDFDDFRGDCYNGRKFPLLNAIYQQIMIN